MLWGKAAARCQFAGCNKLLCRSSVTQEQVNIAQKAHIYAFRSSGPRGNSGIAKARLNDLNNLILVCHECHQKIDRNKDGGRYSASLLQSWKAEHERRVERVTGINPRRKSHVLLFGANIGEQNCPLSFDDAAAALFPAHYPAEDKPIVLGMFNSAWQDRDHQFWATEEENLKRQFRQRIGERLATGELKHLSVFALAPQPLLILLGSLLTDIPEADVFQRHREPQTWHWPNRYRPQGFQVRDSAKKNGSPVLVLSLSATITDERITSIIPDACIWGITIPKPHNDFTKSRTQLSEFRLMIRPLLDRIKARHGQTTPLHIFPAASVSVAVELGRVRMPKADAPWKIYDQVNQRGGFIHALTLS